MIPSVATVVVVQSDDLAAWIGLAGVALGALLSTGATWLQRRSSERKNEHNETRAAVAEMLAGAESLAVIIRAFNTSDSADNSLLDWLPLITLQTERLQKAATIVGASRNATPELVASAGKLSGAAILCARLNGADDSLEKLVLATENFRPEVAKAGTTMSKLKG
jgi:hypothetical protein